MPKWAMVIDLHRCTGCGDCVTACKVENNVPTVSAEEAGAGRVLAWMEMITHYEGEYPEVKVRRMPKLCFHCDNPPCTRVCPVHATYLGEEGIVGQIYHRCIGCRYCQAACPYTAKVFNWYEPEWEGALGSCHNPDVSVRMAGVVEKCSFCSHRLIMLKEQAAIEDRPIRDGEYVPACAESCPADAIIFGDLENREAQVTQLARSSRAFREMDDLGTEPKVIYLAERMSEHALKPYELDEDAALFRPIYETGRGFYITVAVLLAIFAWSVYMWITQVWYGLGVTGMNQPVTWGFYIVNFVFFIGISHAGTLISAILRLSKAEWRRPITRMAEVITAIVLAIGGLHPILDLGRPDRMAELFTAGRLQSPLLWDVTSITAYFTASTVYLFLPMIPDIARLRDQGGKLKWLYTFMAWGWRGTERQQKVLNRAINILMVMVIPIAISVHTVISYIFSMTLQPGWHSTIFGPYFVVGAIFSGIAALLIVMIIFRRVYHLEAYLKEIHFRYLGTLLLIMSLLWFYFTFSEYLTGVFGSEPHELEIIWYKFTGPFALYFWSMVICNFIIPVVFLGVRKLKTITGVLIASIAVVIGMWLERFIIVVPSLANPRLEIPVGIYVPSLVEWALFLGGLSAFALGYVLFAKFFPLISIWEINEGRKEGTVEVEERIRSYLPDTTPPVAPAELHA